MKATLYLLVFLNSFFAIAQSTTPALKVYLEDAYTGKNIKDAKVTLEGFEIPEIIGKYDKKGKYYYFDVLPAGYNTVMAYHEKYNEKGFKDVNGLPAELRLQLHDPRGVYYSFEKPILSSIEGKYRIKTSYQKKLEKMLDSNELGLSLPNFKYLYQEDPYHIAILTKMNGAEFSNDTIKKTLTKLSLEITLSLRDTTINRVCNCYGTNSWGNLYYEKDVDYKDGSVFRGCDNILGWESKYRIFFLNKKSRQKFSRFNSNEIKQLRDLGFVVMAITYRKVDYFGKDKFNPDEFFNINSRYYSEYITQATDNYFLSNVLKEPFQTIYTNLASDLAARSKGIVLMMPRGDDNAIPSVNFVFPVNGKGAIGLGILDIATKKDIKHTYIFTNSFNN